jgi:hypothetical protein
VPDFKRFPGVSGRFVRFAFTFTYATPVRIGEVKMALNGAGEFGDALASLCSREMLKARGNAGRVADMVERLSHCLSFTIAVGSNGDDEVAKNLLSGVEFYLYEGTTGLVPMAKAIKEQP